MELRREHCSHLAPRAPVKRKLKVMGLVSAGTPIANAASRSVPSPGSTASIFLRFLGNPGTIRAVTTVVGAALRFHLLGAKNLWLDEGVSVWLASIPWSRFVHTMVSSPELNMVLYYTMLRGWLHLGQTEFAIRSLSALFGIASIPAIYKLGQRLFTTQAGLVAAALLAVHSFHIRYSQEARAYSLEVFLLLLSTFFFLQITEAPSRRGYWLAYILLSGAAVYCHFFAVLVVLAHWAAIGRGRLRAIGMKAIVSIASGFGLLLTPFAIHILFEKQQGLTWIPRPTLMFFLGTMRLLSGSGDGARTVSSLSLTVFYAICCALALWGSYLRGRGVVSEKEAFATRLTLAWIVIPIAVTLIISLLAKPLFYSRFLLMCVPAIVLLAAQGLVTLGRLADRRHVALTAASALMISLSLLETHRFFANFPFYGHNWSAVVRYVLNHQQPGDAVAISMGLESFDYYLGREARPDTPVPTITFPPVIGNGDRGFEPERVLEQASRNHARIWLVFQSALQGRVSANSPRSLQPADEIVFPGIADGELRLMLFEKR
jgi:Dolichyl-phosphate-mannose-protein mannosyltransferase